MCLKLHANWTYFNLFHASLFRYPLKTLENFWFSVVFRRYRKRLVAWNGLTGTLPSASPIICYYHTHTHTHIHTHHKKHFNLLSQLNGWHHFMINKNLTWRTSYIYHHFDKNLSNQYWSSWLQYQQCLSVCSSWIKQLVITLR